LAAVGRTGGQLHAVLVKHRPRLLHARRSRNESAFRELVGRFDSGLRRMARLYVEAPAADDVVQDA